MELQEGVKFYNARRAGLGLEFKAEVRAAIERIKQFPEAWSPLSEGIRLCRTARFPYGVIYQVRGNEIMIIAVAHLHREPEYWRDRLRGES